jgi:TPR repeat protein/S1-C subfamily serine protease
MKANPLACVLLVLLAVAVQLPAQHPVTSSGTNATIKGRDDPLGIETQQQVSPTNTNATATNKVSATWVVLSNRLANFSVTINDDELKALEKRAQQGYAEAQWELGNRYKNGYGVQKDTTNALVFFQKAADQGDALALEELGRAYRYGEGVGRDLGKAETLFWKAYNANNDSADLNLDLLAAAYTKGDGVPKNVPRAINIYKKLIESSSRFSILGEIDPGCRADELARIYREGDGVPKDMAEAAKWYRKAAEQGDADAQFWLGWAYEMGKGVETNIVGAVKWYRKAAEQGNADAQFALGCVYQDGGGVPKNFSEAIKWYRKAAEQGTTAAEDRLGSMYQNGQGVPQDYSEALKWYRKAAEQGDHYGQDLVGMMYQLGQGVPQDYVEAYKWYNLAAAQGDSIAIGHRDEIVSDMTPGQIAEAQRLSREFKPHQESGSDNSSTSPDNPTATGTGFFITDDGYLISNYHVVKDATQVRLLTRAGTIPAKVVTVDEANDIALLKAVGKFSPLPIAASRTVRLGNMVATVGFPNIGLQGFSPKLAKGEIASLSGAQDNVRYFQISVPVQPGNSGGALVDEHGNVVGIVSAKLSARAALAESGALPENVNYAVKSGFLLSFLESVPEVSAKLKEPVMADRKFEDVVKSAQDAAVLVLVY